MSKLLWAPDSSTKLILLTWNFLTAKFVLVLRHTSHIRLSDGIGTILTSHTEFDCTNYDSHQILLAFSVTDSQYLTMILHTNPQNNVTKVNIANDTRIGRTRQLFMNRVTCKIIYDDAEWYVTVNPICTVVWWVPNKYKTCMLLQIITSQSACGISRPLDRSFCASVRDTTGSTVLTCSTASTHAIWQGLWCDIFVRYMIIIFLRYMASSADAKANKTTKPCVVQQHSTHASPSHLPASARLGSVQVSSALDSVYPSMRIKVFEVPRTSRSLDRYDRQMLLQIFK